MQIPLKLPKCMRGCLRYICLRFTMIVTEKPKKKEVKKSKICQPAIRSVCHVASSSDRRFNGFIRLHPHHVHTVLAFPLDIRFCCGCCSEASVKLLANYMLIISIAAADSFTKLGENRIWRKQAILLLFGTLWS